MHDYALQVQQALNPKPESDGTENKDFLTTALEACKKFNEEIEGTFDK